MLVTRIIVVQVGTAPDRTAVLKIERDVIAQPEGAHKIVSGGKINRTPTLA